ncbi:Phospholipid-transporting ATPase IC, partial [Bonamia ostreae]
KRRKEDRIENDALVSKYDHETDSWIKIKRKDIGRGDILCLGKNDPVPADILLVQTSLPGGLCSISTTNLDGETNLKIKRSFEEIDFMDCPNEQIEKAKFKKTLNGYIKGEPPNVRMGSNGWKGFLYYQNGEKSSTVALDMDQFLIRGTVIKNTDWIICLVIFVGNETKIQQQDRMKKYILKSS